MTTPKQSNKVEEIAPEALERNPIEQAAFLNEVCPRDQSLPSEVNSLPAAHGQAEGFSVPPWHVLGEHVGLPAAVGSHRLERLAQHTEPVKRWIALKLIDAGFIDSDFVQRFLVERRFLALMNHSPIANVFDAGTTLAAQPYFALENVEGLPIADYCDQEEAGVP